MVKNPARKSKRKLTLRSRIHTHRSAPTAGVDRGLTKDLCSSIDRPDPRGSTAPAAILGGVSHAPSPRTGGAPCAARASTRPRPAARDPARSSLPSGISTPEPPPKGSRSPGDGPLRRDALASGPAAGIEGEWARGGAGSGAPHSLGGPLRGPPPGRSADQWLPDGRGVPPAGYSPPRSGTPPGPTERSFDRPRHGRRPPGVDDAPERGRGGPGGGGAAPLQLASRPSRAISLKERRLSKRQPRPISFCSPVEISKRVMVASLIRLCILSYLTSMTTRVFILASTF